MTWSKIPTGGQLLGKIVSAFDLYGVVCREHRESLGKTAQRFFAEGRNVRPSCALIHSLGWVITGTPHCNCDASPRVPQLFAPVLFKERMSGEFASLLLSAAHAHALAWDLNIRPALAERPELAPAVARFATLDAAVKAAAFRLNAGLPMPSEEPPAWACPKRRGEPLVAFVDAHRGSESLAALADRLGVAGRAIGAWRRHQRPRYDYLKIVVDGLAPPERRNEELARLSRHYALSFLCDELRTTFGVEFVEDLVRVYLSVVRCRMMDREMPEAVRLALDALIPFSLAFSSWFVGAEGFHAVARHHAPDWLHDIERATGLWSIPLPQHPAERVRDVLAYAAALHGETLDPRLQALLRGSNDTAGSSHA